MENYTLPLRE
jgi:hypothetical protein